MLCGGLIDAISCVQYTAEPDLGFLSESRLYPLLDQAVHAQSRCYLATSAHYFYRQVRNNRDLTRFLIDSQKLND